MRDGLKSSLDLLTIYSYKDIITIKSSADSAILEDIPIFKFWINPNKLKISRKKLTTQVLTKARHEILHWYPYNDMIILSYSGVSGTLYNDDVTHESSLVESDAWQNFEMCKVAFDSAAEDLTLVFDGQYYTGSFESFDFDRDANNPYLISYDFVFKSYPENYLS